MYQVHVCVRGVYVVQTKYVYTGTAPQQQYNCRSSVSSSCLCARDTVYVCVLGARQEIEPGQHYIMNTSNATSNTHGRTSYQVHEAYSSSKSNISSIPFFVTTPDMFRVCWERPSYISLERLCLSSLELQSIDSDAPGVSSQPHPERGTCMIPYNTVQYIDTMLQFLSLSLQPSLLRQ